MQGFPLDDRHMGPPKSLPGGQSEKGWRYSWERRFLWRKDEVVERVLDMNRLI